MRELKFRVWDKENNCFFKPTYEAYKGKLEDLSIDLSGELTMHTFGVPFIHESLFPNRFMIQQYTGLKDKNGKEIYEGDIYIGQLGWCDGYLKKQYPREINVICEVRYTNGRFNGVRIKPTDDHKEAYENNHYRELLYQLAPWHSVKEQNERIEVVGNIYENPELLQ